MPTPRETLPRRTFLQGAACVGAAGILSGTACEAGGSTGAIPAEPFLYCLNTATIRGFKLPLPEQIELTAKAGYQAIEPWLSDSKQFVEGGGSLRDLHKRTTDLGLRVISAITFSSWMVDDDAKRSASLETYKREMDLLLQLGDRQIAAPPSGGKDMAIPLPKIAERYRAVLEVGRQMGVVPQLEVWGAVKSLSRLSEAAFVATEAGHADACLLLDAYQLHRGNSPIEGLRLLNGAAMHAFHINDYPADPPRESLTDAHRVYPGDGVGPLGEILRTLAASGFRGALSLELFNRDYWQKEPLWVARTGLEKTRAVVLKALSGS